MLENGDESHLSSAPMMSAALILYGRTTIYVLRKAWNRARIPSVGCTHDERRTHFIREDDYLRPENALLARPTITKSLDLY
jgi:hypothetical protein